MAEIELSVMTRQCLKQRIPDFDLLMQQVKAWNEKRNKEQSRGSLQTIMQE